MKQHLLTLKQTIDHIDNDPVRSMRFWTTSCSNTHEGNKPPDDIRYKLVVDTLYTIEAQILNKDIVQVIQDPDFCRMVDEKLDRLDRFYQQHQEYTWRSHDHHFHTSFAQYVNCPITCLTEISEFLGKIVKENFGI